MDKSQK